MLSRVRRRPKGAGERCAVRRNGRRGSRGTMRRVMCADATCCNGWRRDVPIDREKAIDRGQLRKGQPRPARLTQPGPHDVSDVPARTSGPISRKATIPWANRTAAAMGFGGARAGSAALGLILRRPACRPWGPALLDWGRDDCDTCHRKGVCRRTTPLARQRPRCIRVCPKFG